MYFVHALINRLNVIYFIFSDDHNLYTGLLLGRV